MKKIFIILISLFMILSLSACSDDRKKEETVEEEAAAEETENADMENENSEMEGKILVVYFSWSGNLDKMAHWVAEETGGDLYRVIPFDPYPDDYNATADRAKREQDDGVRPEIDIDISEEQMSEYETVFFGFPVWWYDLPMSMWTFLESYDLSGKTIFPFFSHEGSSNGANALSRIKELAVGADVRSDDALSIRGRNVEGSKSDVIEWIDQLNY